MTFDGIVLYGPPASGKDTVTAELCKLSGTYSYFEKLKVGEGRAWGYRVVSKDVLVDLRSRGLIVHEVARYRAIYAVDTLSLDELREEKRIPIVHMGQIAGVEAVKQHGGRWLDVLLWCSKDVTEKRLRQRGSVDIGDRIDVWDATLADLGSFAGPPFTLSVRTDSIEPVITATVIHAAMKQ